MMSNFLQLENEKCIWLLEKRNVIFHFYQSQKSNYGLFDNRILQKGALAEVNAFDQIKIDLIWINKTKKILAILKDTIEILNALLALKRYDCNIEIY